MSLSGFDLIPMNFASLIKFIRMLTTDLPLGPSPISVYQPIELSLTKAVTGALHFAGARLCSCV